MNGKIKYKTFRILTSMLNIKAFQSAFSCICKFLLHALIVI